MNPSDRLAQLAKDAPTLSFRWLRVILNDSSNRRLFLLVIVGFIAAFVWPTLYRYAAYGPSVVRINRITMAADLLTPDGWRPFRPR